MSETVKLLHVGLQNETEEQARLFYTTVLGCKVKKTFTLEEKLAKEIFGVNGSLKAIQFQGDSSVFEVFILKPPTVASTMHVCIEVADLDSFLLKCRRYEITPRIIHREQKTLYFISDFSGNLFEVKEKQK